MADKKDSIAYIGLGSNKGNKLGYLKKAVQKLNDDGNCTVIQASSVYETKPYGYKEQENFLNAAVKIKTEYPFTNLLDRLKQIEKKIGREKTIRWGPREIDLDLLLFNDVVYSDARITIPHKEIASRDFVLVPLCEISPDLIHPALNVKICDICIDESEYCIIRKLPDSIL